MVVRGGDSRSSSIAATTLRPRELALELYQQRPELFAQLETLRDASRELGEYQQAAQAQLALERAMSNEEKEHLQALKELHSVQLEELEANSAEEYSEFRALREAQLAALTKAVSEQEQTLQQRHKLLEQDLEQCSKKDRVRPKWSSALLDLRSREEHMIKQRSFIKAAHVKAAADKMEELEQVAVAGALQARHTLEVAKLQAEHARESDALRKKLQVQYDDHVLHSERALDKLIKRTSASRLALLRLHANQQLHLQQALKGWMQPRKVGLPPPPLKPLPPPTAPGKRVALQAHRRGSSLPKDHHHWQQTCECLPSGGPSGC